MRSIVGSLAAGGYLPGLVQVLLHSAFLDHAESSLRLCCFDALRRSIPHHLHVRSLGDVVLNIFMFGVTVMIRCSAGYVLLIVWCFACSVLVVFADVFWCSLYVLVTLW